MASSPATINRLFLSFEQRPSAGFRKEHKKISVSPDFGELPLIIIWRVS